MAGVKGLLFDFDGLLVETEWSAYKAWAELFEDHGHELTLHEWSSQVGTISDVDFIARLASLTGTELDGKALRARRLARKVELLEQELLRPGVQSYLADSATLGLKTAIVTSSPRCWIVENLTRVACDHDFDLIISAEEDPSIAKPSPFLYQRALGELGLSPDEAIAFEDSPNGVRAAKGAGLFCVAIPNKVTEGLDLSEADLQLLSLEEISLSDLLVRGGRESKR